ncbi:unnamed protein product [Linum tenue]|uniref:Uncharacterized protein n=1 Tax=Linum tenue TaxID=586396 RepID=A0AAV0NV80_9ROSI|nr:unnamed protein product [Linum tenue]
MTAARICSSTRPPSNPKASGPSSTARRPNSPSISRRTAAPRPSMSLPSPDLAALLRAVAEAGDSTPGEAEAAEATEEG